LDMNAQVAPEILHRGIFDAVVYNTKIKVNGKFSPLELQKSGIKSDMILWDKVKLAIGITDLKGLKKNPSVNLNTKVYPVEADFSALALFKNNLVILADMSKEQRTDLEFSFDLDLRGSNELNFLPLGKTTQVKVSGNWNNPSFTGRNLPEQREVGDKNFSATWSVPYFNRPYPQQWIADNEQLHGKTDAAFGVGFILPVDQYQKTTRSAKYGILIILLTFISLFITEVMTKKKVHILQYILIGAAMIIYYVLLLSFSEQLGFNLAYLIASAATVLLIGTFIAALLKQRKPALLFGSILTVFYGFIFVIIQLQDLALLIGSIGLFVIVAILMYFSAKIDWSKYNTPQQ
ncbi:MAG: cell envelope integrity protein CreD, partial [Pedobacter sp.]